MLYNVSYKKKAIHVVGPDRLKQQPVTVNVCISNKSHVCVSPKPVHSSGFIKMQ